MTDKKNAYPLKGILYTGRINVVWKLNQGEYYIPAVMTSTKMEIRGFRRFLAFVIELLYAPICQRKIRQ